MPKDILLLLGSMVKVVFQLAADGLKVAVLMCRKFGEVGVVRASSEDKYGENNTCLYTMARAVFLIGRSGTETSTGLPLSIAKIRGQRVIVSHFTNYEKTYAVEAEFPQAHTNVALEFAIIWYFLQIYFSKCECLVTNETSIFYIPEHSDDTRNLSTGGTLKCAGCSRRPRLHSNCSDHGRGSFQATFMSNFSIALQWLMRGCGLECMLTRSWASSSSRGSLNGCCT